MSKRMNRVALAVVISLAVVAGVYTSVLGASLHAGRISGSIHVTVGLMPDLSHYRSPISLNTYYPDLQGPTKFHDCGGDDAGVDPND
jgi:hypothetical protein